MYPWVAGTAGYALLMSSFVNFIIIIRKALKHHVISSFYSLSISDILTSILIGVLLILNHSEMSIMTYTTSNINTSTTPGNTWNYESFYKKEYKVASSMYEELNRSNITNEFDENEPCGNITSVLMHYAMLLVPFTNAFVSLLTFCMQCNLNAVSMNARCIQLFKCKHNNENKQENHGNNKNITVCSSNDDYFNASTSRHFTQVIEGETDLDDKVSVREKDPNITATLKNIVSNNFKETNVKSIFFYIMVQWFVPIMITGALYFAHYRNMNVMAKTENMECIFQVNFPFNNCYMYTEGNNSHKMLHINHQKVPAKDKYTANENLLKILDPNNTKVNQVVSEIQKIVESEWHNIYNTSNNINLPILYNISQPTNEINYYNMKESNASETIELYPIKVASVQNKSVSFNMPEAYIQSNPIPETEIISTEDDSELTLFEELLEKASQEGNTNMFEKQNFYHNTDENISKESNSMNHDIQTEATAIGTSTDQLITTETIQSSHKTSMSMSNDQIYADIVKRIQNVGSYTGLRDKNKGNYYQYIKKKPKQSNLEYQYLPIHLPFITQLFLKPTNTVSANINEEMICTKQMQDKCFVSANFVKFHLLVLMFIIYFLPILFSAILQERGKLVCQNILEKLESKVTMTSTTTNLFEVEDINNEASRIDKTQIFWYPRNENITCGLGRKTISNLETQANTNLAISESNGQLDQNEQTYMCMLQMTKSIQEHFHSIKMSLLFAIILWTPMFLELLLKVFLCTHISKWVTSISFLSAISFNILRNIFNLKLIQISDNNTNGNRKENTVHPTV